ncbi:FMN-binding glutamate synthase family protein [Luteimonas sp. MJ246]|uniref:FMN-binding glutamate synthase family protein n=1 Tax=Luteimonas sp. MJ174 TaxID=3129237 RepID=UPI0031BB21C7
MTYRYTAWFVCIALAIVGLVLAYTWSPHWWWLVTVAGALALLGLADVMQRTSTLRQLYPVLAHFRYGLESIGPEIRQYFIERDTEEVPFSREQRALVYQRAKREQDTVPFGTIHDVYGKDYEWINHSLAPTHLADHDFRVRMGEESNAPYDASVFNISAMSFGSLSANAIRALNLGAKRGGFHHDTGEGSISSYHREHGGDLVWEIGSGYFGCRDEQGRFDPVRFADNAADPQVKMIEIKLSQGAKPGHGGMLPGAKVTPEIALARGVPVGVDCISPAQHSAFGSPIGLLEFVAGLRQLAGGKPVGFKLAIGHPWEWFGVAKAMRETGILPDFIVVDGAEGGTGASPVEFMNHIGVPMNEALMLVHNTLVGVDLRDRIRVGAAGKITSAFDIARTLALGADFCNAGRAFMFALGCIQARSCHNDLCPTGIATQDPRRWTHLDVEAKADRVAHYHRNTLNALRELLCAAGLSSPAELGPEHIVRRVSEMHVSSLANIYHFLQPGELLAGVPERHAVFKNFWEMARAGTFAPPPRVLEMRTSKSH